MAKEKPSRAKFPVKCRVKILNPTFATRVGYPLCADDLMEEAEKILVEKGIIPATGRVWDGGRPGSLWSVKKVHRKPDEKAVIRKYAVLLLRHKGWGGKDRTVHTVHKPEYAEAKMTVIGSRSAYTGGYCAPQHYGYGEDYDFDPGGLYDRKHHTLLLVDPDIESLQPCLYYEPRERDLLWKSTRWSTNNANLVIQSTNVVRLDMEKNNV